MSTPTLTRDLAWSAAQDAANASMRAAGRSKWSQDDYRLAVETFDRLWPEERDYTEDTASTALRPGTIEQILQDAVGPHGRVTRLSYRDVDVYHIDGDPTNNDLDNLEARSARGRLYPCAKCGKLRTEAEGGAIFTVCDGCWDSPDTERGL